MPDLYFTTGMEFEYNSKSYDYDSSIFSDKGDASCGSELVSKNIIATTEDLKSVVNSAFNTLKRASIDDRCGYHVHLGLRDEVSALPHEVVTRFMSFFYRNQEIFFRLCPVNRYSCGYCDPIDPAYKNRMRRIGYWSGRFDKSRRYAHVKSDRYCWINYCASYEKPTIEFRLQHGNIIFNKQNTLAWLYFLQAACKFALDRAKDKTIPIDWNLKTDVSLDQFSDFLNEIGFKQYTESIDKNVDYFTTLVMMYREDFIGIPRCPVSSTPITSPEVQPAQAQS